MKYPVLHSTCNQYNGIFHDLTILAIIYYDWNKNLKFYNVFCYVLKFAGWSQKATETCECVLINNAYNYKWISLFLYLNKITNFNSKSYVLHIT
jgi:hypothetical protein